MHCITFLVELHIKYSKMDGRNLLRELLYLILKIDHLDGNLSFFSSVPKMNSSRRIPCLHALVFLCPFEASKVVVAHIFVPYCRF